MKGKLAFMIFFAIVFLVNLLVNVYIFSRTKTIFPSQKWAWWLSTALFWILAFSYIMGRFAERTGPMWFAEPFVKLGSWWMGAMVYLTLLFLLVDTLRAINSFTSFTDFFRFSWQGEKGTVALLSVYAVTAVILAIGYYNASVPVVRWQKIALEKPVPEGIQRVVLVSDIHLGMMISNGRLDTLVSLVNRQNADVILLAGDVFDEDLGPVIRNNMGDLLKNLNAKYGVYAVLGNHEFYGNASAAQEYLEDHRITVLRDSIAILPNGIIIAGREDITGKSMYGKARKSLDELLRDADTQYPVLLIDHQPYNLSEATAWGVDLQVSGHTHHGQMWPFNHITRAIFEISSGYGQIGNSHFYVSSGYGTWGPPIRTNSRSEIVVIEISGNS